MTVKVMVERKGRKWVNICIWYPCDDSPGLGSKQNGEQSLAGVDERSAQLPTTLPGGQGLVLLRFHHDITNDVVNSDWSLSDIINDDQSWSSWYKYNTWCGSDLVHVVRFLLRMSGIIWPFSNRRQGFRTKNVYCRSDFLSRWHICVICTQLGRRGDSHMTSDHKEAVRQTTRS